MPRFSIIVPIYNVEEYLRECLESVLKQDMTDWEAICIDDGSPDSSGAIADAMAAAEPRISVIHQTNQGLSAARNRGIEAAKGDYLLFLDSDDWLTPNALSTLDTLADGCDMVCFGCRRTDTNRIDTLEAERTTGPAYYNRYALQGRVVPFVCTVQRCYRRAWVEAEGLRFMEGVLHEDQHFTPIACMAAKEVNITPQCLYTYRVRMGSISTSASAWHCESLVQIANDLAQRFSHPSDTLRRAIVQCYQVAYLRSTRPTDRILRSSTDWARYRHLATHLRHRFNLILIRISPTIYRWVYHKPSHL